MYDHQSDTLWSQFLSRGVKGPLANTELEIVPDIQSTWQGWMRLHPDTIVLDKRGRYLADSYEGYYTNGSAGIIGESNKDKRLPRKDLVLGVTISGLAKAYPFETISGQKVIKTTLPGRTWWSPSTPHRKAARSSRGGWTAAPCTLSPTPASYSPVPPPTAHPEMLLTNAASP